MEPADFMADLDGLQVDDSSVKKTRKLASRKAGSNIGDDTIGEGDAVEPPPAPVAARKPRRSGANITFQQKLTAMTFFRVCDFCLNHDNGADPIEPAYNRYWMYYVTVKLLVQIDGRCCYDCSRVFQATANKNIHTT